MPPDEVVRLGKSLLQHGPANDRVYLMKLHQEDLPGIVRDICELGERNSYTKLLARAPAEAKSHFEDEGFVAEARIPGMHKGESAGYFMGKYLDPDRAVPVNEEKIAEVLALADKKAGARLKPDGGNGDVARLGIGDSEALAQLYATVFETYPFPVHDPAFLRRAMSADTEFFGIHSGGRLVAAASMEMDKDWRCVEMTDFATAPEHRGKGAAGTLLAAMDRRAAELRIQTAYTIARAESAGMNVVFARAGYVFSGTLTNNTQIAGKLESMNLWCKRTWAA